MRVSSYNIGAMLPDREAFILLHGLTGAVDKLSSRLGNFLVVNRNEILQNDISIPEEYCPVSDWKRLYNRAVGSRRK